MEPLIFNTNISEISLSYIGMPVLNIIRINFLTDDKQYINRLYNANLNIKIMAFDKENNDLGFQ